jgi:hypothetical protein
MDFAELDARNSQMQAGFRQPKLQIRIARFLTIEDFALHAGAAMDGCDFAAEDAF